MLLRGECVMLMWFESKAAAVVLLKCLKTFSTDGDVATMMMKNDNVNPSHVCEDHPGLIYFYIPK